ncbi:MAG TPA: sialidase family protein [Ktedonobacterales bacterium]
MTTKRLWIAGASIVVLALVATTLAIALPTHAAAGGSNTSRSSSSSSSQYSQPRWWAKYQVVSAPGFKPAPTAGKTSSVKVGANVNVSDEPGPQSETSIAINPNHPSQIVGGSNEIFRLPMRGYFSSDGGATWGGVDLPLPPPISQNGFDFGSDPGVAWDLHGNVYYSYIVVFFSAGGSINGTEMAVARSSDGGQSWTATFFSLAGPGNFNDKPMIAVDTNPSSPNANTVYVAWDTTVNGKGGPSSSGIEFSRSTDGGVSFSAPAVISATGGGQHFGISADPFVGPDGRVYVAWHDISNAILVRSSANGGATFGAITTVAPTRIAFDALIPPQNLRGALVYPACGADRSTGAFRGRLYCSWMDSNSAGDTDIFLATSTNQGATWSAPLTVNDDGGGSYQFNQWLAVDPVTGAVDLSWNDSRNDPTNASTDVYFAQSTNGGASVSPNVKVTTAPTNETVAGADLGNQYGDYEGIDARGGSVHPIWTDRRAGGSVDGFEEVFTATLTVK